MLLLFKYALESHSVSHICMIIVEFTRLTQGHTFFSVSYSSHKINKCICDVSIMSRLVDIRCRSTGSLLGNSVTAWGAGHGVSGIMENLSYYLSVCVWERARQAEKNLFVCDTHTSCSLWGIFNRALHYIQRTQFDSVPPINHRVFYTFSVSSLSLFVSTVENLQPTFLTHRACASHTWTGREQCGTSHVTHWTWDNRIFLFYI